MEKPRLWRRESLKSPACFSIIQVCASNIHCRTSIMFREPWCTNHLYCVQRSHNLDEMIKWSQTGFSSSHFFSVSECDRVSSKRHQPRCEAGFSTYNLIVVFWKVWAVTRELDKLIEFLKKKQKTRRTVFQKYQKLNNKWSSKRRKEPGLRGAPWRQRTQQTNQETRSS